jgi:ribosomal protein L37AE/L43A
METPTTTCPFCKSVDVKRYAYGLLAFNSKAEEEQFKADHILAGCEITPTAPLYHCDNCKKDFGHLRGK